MSRRGVNEWAVARMKVLGTSKCQPDHPATSLQVTPAYWKLLPTLSTHTSWRDLIKMQVLSKYVEVLLF